MQQYVQYLPTIAAALSGAIGIFLKLSGSTKAWLQYILLAVIAASFCAGLYLTSEKIESDAKAKAYAAATGVRWDQGFDESIFVIGINDDSRNGDGEMLDDQGRVVESYLPLTQTFFPEAPDGTNVGALELFGSGLQSHLFHLSTCGGEVVVLEQMSDGTSKRYFSDDFQEPAIQSLACSKDVRSGRREAENGQTADVWVYDEPAGGIAHVIDVNSGENAGPVLSYAEQSELIARMTIENIPDAAVYTQYLEKMVTFELKFYQNLRQPNPLAEGCTSVYKIPLKQSIEKLSATSLAVVIQVAQQGNFIKCELSPI